MKKAVNSRLDMNYPRVIVLDKVLSVKITIEYSRGKFSNFRFRTSLENEALNEKIVSLSNVYFFT